MRKDVDHGLFVASIVDIAHPESVRSAAVQCGPVSMLVNNAGVASVSELGALTDEQILRCGLDKQHVCCWRWCVSDKHAPHPQNLPGQHYLAFLHMSSVPPAHATRE